MADVDPRFIEKLLDEVEKLAKTIQSVGNIETGNLVETAIRDVRAAVFNGADQFDPARWTEMSERKKIEAQDKLIMARDKLRAIARTVDHHEKNQVAGNAASPAAIIWLAIFSLIFAATLLSLIR